MAVSWPMRRCSSLTLLGASHFNDAIAFLGVSLYDALCEHETEEFTTIDAKDALFEVEAEVVLL